MRAWNHIDRRGFSLIELVIVVVILGVIGGIAIPRLSRGAEGAADSALIADLAVLRNAIDLYTTEHEGLLPSEAGFVNQMTLYSDISGATNAAKGGAFIYGPYMRAIPPLPVNGEGPATKGMKGDTGVAGAAAAGIAWVYDETTGAVNANTAGREDAKGTKYADY